MSKRCFRVVVLCGLCLGALSTPSTGAPVDAETAQRVAQNWLTERAPGGFDTGGLLVRTVEVEGAEGILHVFNLVPRGFVIVAADDAVFPVLGYSFEGEFTGEGYPPAFNDLLQYYLRASRDAITRRGSATPECRAQWDRLRVERGEFQAQDVRDVLPLLTTEWHQVPPWNNQCPADAGGPGGHVPAGCGAVAMAQVMRYWETPTQGTGSHGYWDPNSPQYGFLFADFGATTYNWAGMPDMVCQPATEQLLFHCGVAIEMNYGPDVSISSAYDIASALGQFFRYESHAYYEQKNGHANNVWESMLRSELEAGRPLVYRGANSMGQEGHLFNVDGYVEWEGTSFHVNWGWSGQYDGFYYLGELTPGAPGDNDFSYFQGAVFGIRPFSGSSVSVTSPAAGSTWPVGIDSRTVRWAYAGVVSSVDILLSRNGGQSWETIVDGTECDGSYPWMVTGPASTTCVIRVQDHESNGDRFDDSFVFTICGELPEPTDLTANLDQQTGSVALNWNDGNGGFYEDFADGVADNFVFSDDGFWVADDYLKWVGENVSDTWASTYYNHHYYLSGCTVGSMFRRVAGDLGYSIGTFFGCDGFPNTESANGYLVNVVPAGYYSAWRLVNGVPTSLIPWTQSSAINTGLNVDNVVLIRISGALSFDIFVNGTYVDSFSEDGTYGSGVVGVCAYDASGATSNEVWWKAIGLAPSATVLDRIRNETSRAITGPQAGGDITFCAGASVDNDPVPAIGLRELLKPDGRDFLHYTVYRDGSSVGTTTNITYTDDLPASGAYAYEVAAAYNEGESDRAGPVTVVWGATIDLEAILDGAAVGLSWPPYPGASAYWIYGADNAPFFEPGLTSPYVHRQDVTGSDATSWWTMLGVGDPDHNWTFLVIAVDASGNELARSNRAGECDYAGDTP